MKSGLLGLTAMAILSFASMQVNAKVREFRVNRGTITEHGYATAWGFEGMKVDFEKIEDENKVDEFMEKNGEKMRGYLVDLKTDEIIAVLSDEPDFVVASFGGYNFGNRNGYSIQEMPFAGGDTWSQHMIGVVNHSRWSTALNELILIKDKNENSSRQEVVFRLKDIEQRLDTLLTSKMSAEEKKFFDNAGAIEKTILVGTEGKRASPKIEGKFGVKFSAYVPKSDLETELKGVSLFQLTVTPDQKNVDIKLLKSSKRMIGGDKK